VRVGTAVRLPRGLNLRGIFVHDLPLKITAIVIAILFAIGSAQNAAPRELTLQFDGRVPVERPEIPTGFVLRGNLGDVAVTLRGPEGVVDKMALADLHATLDLKGIDAGRPEPHDAKVDVTVSNPDVVKVVDITPPVVSVRLERITSRVVVVQAKFANEPPKGTQAGTSGVSPKEVRISGPESAVLQTTAALATVRFGDTTTDVTASVPAIPVDANGVAIDGLQVDPAVVVVSVPLLPTATTKTVPVLWTIRGTVAAGYWISQVATDPVAVTLRGEQSAISKVERIDTAAIDVTGLSATKVFRTPLALPEGVTLVNPVDASVTVTVVPLAATRPFLIAVQVINLGPGLIGETDPSSETVIVGGPGPAIAGLTADQITLTVDAAGHAAGTYTVDAAIKAPSGVAVQSVQPGRVTLTIRSK
jgi:YbbR domain-containing protein